MLLRHEKDKTRRETNHLLPYNNNNRKFSTNRNSEKEAKETPIQKQEKTHQSTPPTSLENMAEPSNCKKNSPTKLKAKQGGC